MLAASAESDGEEFDLLIIGGGATGTGAVLDAATRGLRVALVERDDFASGTSSRSTKLVHGGVRYLEKAFRELDYEQYKLVCEALHERRTFLDIAPYLSTQLPIMLPVYKWWQVPYYWAGCKAYDFFAGREAIQKSYFLSRSRAIEAFPMLKRDNLVGALVYFDGQHNDSRMAVALALTAVSHGAVVANHTEVTGLIKERDIATGAEKCRGAVVRDTLSGEQFVVKCKGIINATGPFTDAIRKMDDPSIPDIVAPSAGVHIVLPNYYSPENMGLIDPSTSDGRVIFFLPWQGNVVAGTTDSPTSLTFDPVPKESEIQWILDEVRHYLSPDVKVRRGDVLAAWSGIRPLVRDPNASKNSTEALVRNHIVTTSPSGLITIAGGKWTTYRNMAQETIDAAIKEFDLKPLTECRTERVKLIGSHGYSDTMFIKLIQNFGLETEVAKHLAANYGDRAWGVCSLAEPTGKRFPVYGQRLSPLYPYLEAEVKYAIQREYACTAVDVIARRTRLAFLSARAAKESLPRVIDIMAAELNWSTERKEQEQREAMEYLRTMGLPPRESPAEIAKLEFEPRAAIAPSPSLPPVSQGVDPHVSHYERARFHSDEIGRFTAAFSDYDRTGSGHITSSDLPNVLTALGLDPTDSFTASTLTKVTTEIGITNESGIEFDEYLELMSRMKDSFFDQLQPSAQQDNATVAKQRKLRDWLLRRKSQEETGRIPTERSGGGI
ncbi:DAO-domain-containing protein [Ramicandelaber brevisporus]|nr:DAO-domain-containing protein [Ramicandelaber brevisporus]